MKKLQVTILTFTILIFGLSSCKDHPKASATSIVETVEIGNADSKSAKIAEKIMVAMGGSELYDSLNTISWTFFGSRHLVWDKKNNRVRIESSRDTSIMILDMNTDKGLYAKDGIEITDPTAVKKAMVKAKSAWINDSYWLVMPFKLRDEGVNLRYLRKDTIAGGFSADVLELTFNEVGLTPDNKYEVYVDERDDLIKQWDFFKSADQEEPSRSWPWDNYEYFEGLRISTNRSDKSGPSNVRVYQEIDDNVFTSLEPFDFY